MSSLKPDFSVAIIGAGIGGICMALDLQKIGINDYTIYELEGNTGGTWYQNRYPGCRCDVPAILYSHSQFQNPNWSQTHPPREELLEYWQNLAKSQGVDRHVKVRHRFLSAVWHEDTKTYTITVRNEVTGEEVTSEVNVLVSAAGAFGHPAVPKIKGQDEYKGLVVHAARWPFDLDYKTAFKGKTVAVVGNGCAGAQIVSTLADEPDIKVVAIARSPHWYIPQKFANVSAPPAGVTHGPPGRERNSIPYSDAHRKRWAEHPWIQHLQRRLFYLQSDALWLIFPLKRAWLRNIIQNRLEVYQRDKLPVEYKAKGVPTFPLGAKRFVVEDGYLGALNMPNVTPVWGGLSGLTETGIAIEDGRTYDADVVVYASGFDIEANGLDVSGAETKMTDFKHASDIIAYHGIATAGVPNFFTLLGPFSAPGHSSVVFILESQSSYVKQLIGAMRDNGIKRLDIKPQAASKWFAATQARADKIVWTTAKSYMRANGGTGRVWTHYPGHIGSIWWENLWPTWSHWKGAEKLAFRQRAKKAAAVAVVLAAVFVAVQSSDIGRSWLHVLFPAASGALGTPVWDNVTATIGALRTTLTSMIS